eukprot:TRINITY_DN1586_c0_g1_i2.p1 TRINITY_DN1586_c0_g1~~TRINITY_DN1586_c0_g1_i2.p1  ORF type:complete len:1238 (+),score=284.90 TRINITY_DN1586_c0_g1_i2:56-3715(+)
MTTPTASDTVPLLADDVEQQQQESRAPIGAPSSVCGLYSSFDSSTGAGRCAEDESVSDVISSVGTNSSAGLSSHEAVKRYGLSVHTKSMFTPISLMGARGQSSSHTDKKDDEVVEKQQDEADLHMPDRPSVDDVMKQLDSVGSTTWLAYMTLRRFARFLVGTFALVVLGLALLNAAGGYYKDSLLAVFCVVSSSIIGAWVSANADAKVAAFEVARKSSSTAIAMRDGAPARVEVENLVCGDVVSLAPGDYVQVVIRLVESGSTSDPELCVDESSITNKPCPTVKRSVEKSGGGGGLSSLPTNMVYPGSRVTGGRGRGVVVACSRCVTNAVSQLSSARAIAGGDNSSPPMPSTLSPSSSGDFFLTLATHHHHDDTDTDVAGGVTAGGIRLIKSLLGARKTPLEHNAAILGKQMFMLSAIVIAVVFFAGTLVQEKVWTLLFRLTTDLVIVCAPASLPVVVAIATGCALTRVAHVNGVLFGKRVGIEALGAVDVLCVDQEPFVTSSQIVSDSDATQTTTQGPSGLSMDTTAIPEAVVARIHVCNANVTGNTPGDDVPESAGVLLSAAARCSDAVQEAGRWLGRADECAVMRACAQHNVPLNNGSTRVSRVPYDIERRWSSAVCVEEDGIGLQVVVGDPFVVLPACSFVPSTNGAQSPSDVLKGMVPLDIPTKRRVCIAARNMARRGLRLYAVCGKQAAAPSLPSADDATLGTDHCLFGVFAVKHSALPHTVSALKSSFARVVSMTSSSRHEAVRFVQRTGLWPLSDPYPNGLPSPITSADAGMLQDLDDDLGTADEWVTCLVEGRIMPSHPPAIENPRPYYGVHSARFARNPRVAGGHTTKDHERPLVQQAGPGGARPAHRIPPPPIDIQQCVVDAEWLDELDLHRPEDLDKAYNLMRNAVIVFNMRPWSKRRVTQILQLKGEVVAVTGNADIDVPALAEADVAIVPAFDSSSAAKEEADVLLCNPSRHPLGSLLVAVEEARAIHRRVQNYIRFNTTSCLSILWTVFFCELLDLHTPFFPVHFLWIKILIDGPLAITLAFERIQFRSALALPRAPRDGNLVTPVIIFGIFVTSLIFVSLVLLLYCWNISSADERMNFTSHDAVSISFEVFGLLLLGHFWGCRTHHAAFHKQPLANNYPAAIAFTVFLVLQVLFARVGSLSESMNTSFLSVAYICVLFLFALVIEGIEELKKMLYREYLLHETIDEHRLCRRRNTPVDPSLYR